MDESIQSNEIMSDSTLRIFHARQKWKKLTEMLPPSGKLVTNFYEKDHRDYTKKQEVAQHFKSILSLCEIIHEHGCQQSELINTRMITFGKLTDLYGDDSSKLTNLLQRGRKLKFIYFSGEILYKPRDMYVPVILRHTIQTIRVAIKEEIRLLMECGTITNQRSAEERDNDKKERITPAEKTDLVDATPNTDDCLKSASGTADVVAEIIKEKYAHRKESKENISRTKSVVTSKEDDEVCDRETSAEDAAPALAALTCNTHVIDMKTTTTETQKEDEESKHATIDEERHNKSQEVFTTDKRHIDSQLLQPEVLNNETKQTNEKLDSETESLASLIDYLDTTKCNNKPKKTKRYLYLGNENQDSDSDSEFLCVKCVDFWQLYDYTTQLEEELREYRLQSDQDYYIEEVPSQTMSTTTCMTKDCPNEGEASAKYVIIGLDQSIMSSNIMDGLVSEGEVEKHATLITDDEMELHLSEVKRLACLNFSHVFKFPKKLVGLLFKKLKNMI